MYYRVQLGFDNIHIRGAIDDQEHQPAPKDQLAWNDVRAELSAHLNATPGTARLRGV